MTNLNPTNSNNFDIKLIYTIDEEQFQKKFCDFCLVDRLYPMDKNNKQ
jgi:hypothetical protein